jgi:hypothetical protein
VRAALARLEAINDGAGAAGIVSNLAAVELLAGQTHTARVLAEDAVELYRPQGFSRLDALALTFAAELAGLAGDRPAMRRHATEARRLFAELGCRPGERRAAALLTATAATAATTVAAKSR